jgi:hypothetical protein
MQTKTIQCIFIKDVYNFSYASSNVLSFISWAGVTLDILFQNDINIFIFNNRDTTTNRNNGFFPLNVQIVHH